MFHLFVCLLNTSLQGSEIETLARTQEQESDAKTRRYHLDRQRENIGALINCVVNNIGFNQGKPVAAFTIYKCLLHWKSFEAERTSVFDRLVQMIGSAIKVLNYMSSRYN
jgi:myosin-5